MSRDPYRSSTGDLGFAPAPPRAPQRWDADRFAFERDRSRFGGERDRFESPREDRFSRAPVPYRPRERSVDEIIERRGPRGGYEIDKFRERDFYEEPEEPRYAREPVRRARGESIHIEKEREREYFSPSPPRRGGGRPTLLRRQSSLDTFDRKPMFPRFPEREDYGPPARREAYPPPSFAPMPLPRSRALGPPPRRYEREYEDIKVAEPDFYGDEEFRGYPERVREREIIRTKRRSRSRESKSHKSSKSTVRSASSSSSSSSSSEAETVRSEFPKKGKTRMPKKLVNKAAIIALSYPFEEEGDVIIIQKALGRENIDEVIKLSEEYNKVDKYEMSGARSEAGGRGRSEAGDVQKISEDIIMMPPQHGEQEIIKTKTTVEHRDISPASTHRSHHSHAPSHHSHSRSRSVGPPVIVDARPTEYLEIPPPPPGPMALIPTERQLGKDERAIRAEIKALEAEKEALRAEKKANREMRRADRLRREGRESGEMILYEREETIRTRSRSRSRSRGGARIEKDKKGPDPRALKFMLKTLT